MDPYLEDFISYDYQSEPRQEGLLDIKFGLNSPFSDNSNNPSLFSNFMPEIPSSLVSPYEFHQKEPSVYECEVSVQTSQPVEKKKEKKSKSNSSKGELDLSKLYIPPNLQADIGSKLNIQSKKISKADKSSSPENSTDDKDQKKNDQVIRNRISAQNSRDKKKIYLQQLEGENQFLKQEKQFMVEKINRIETAYMQILRENEILKSNSGYICQSCGCSAELKKNGAVSPIHIPEDQNVTTGPNVYREENKKGFFGFSYAFTTLMCLIFVMNGGPSYQAGNETETNTTISFPNTPRTLDTDNYVEPEISIVESPLLSSSGSVQFSKDPDSYLANFGLDKLPIMDSIESKIEEFDAYHESVFEHHRENHDSILDLSNVTTFRTTNTTASNLSKNGSEEGFLPKPTVKSRNKTSTMFCPSGVEFSKGGLSDSFDNESNNSYSLFQNSRNLNRSTKSLHLDKADYIQLLIPRYSIGRLGVSGNSSELDYLNGYSGDEENAMVEVWCKIFAVNGLSRAF